MIITKGVKDHSFITLYSSSLSSFSFAASKDDPFSWDRSPSSSRKTSTRCSCFHLLASKHQLVENQLNGSIDMQHIHGAVWKRSWHRFEVNLTKSVGEAFWTVFTDNPKQVKEKYKNYSQMGPKNNWANGDRTLVNFPWEIDDKVVYCEDCSFPREELWL